MDFLATGMDLSKTAMGRSTMGMDLVKMEAMKSLFIM
jgi:hypothetical protein